METNQARYHSTNRPTTTTSHITRCTHVDGVLCLLVAFGSFAFLNHHIRHAVTHCGSRARISLLHSVHQLNVRLDHSSQQSARVAAAAATAAHSARAQAMTHRRSTQTHIECMTHYVCPLCTHAPVCLNNPRLTLRRLWWSPASKDPFCSTARDCVSTMWS